jgi:hypothetical protein
MLFELRQYKIKPGQRDAWVRLMEDEIIPFQVSKGMVILGSFVGEEDDSVYVWIRRFKDEAERERLYEEVYQSDYWRDEIGPRIPEMMERDAMQVTRLEPTAKSPIQ